MTKASVSLLILLAGPCSASGQEPFGTAPTGELIVSLDEWWEEPAHDAVVFVDGPVRRAGDSDGSRRIRFRDLPSGRYIIRMQRAGKPDVQQRATVVGGLRYEVLLMVSRDSSSDGRSKPLSALGPLAIEGVSIDPDATVRYKTRNSNRLLTFRRLEIHRVFADGSSHRGVHEQDTFETQALNALRIPSFSLRTSWTPPGIAESIQLAKEARRADVPVSADVRIVAVAMADAPPLGDQTVLERLAARRRALIAELGYWIAEITTAMHDFRGVVLADRLTEQFEVPRPGETTPDFRLAMRQGIGVVRATRASDADSDRIVEGLLKSVIQFHDAAHDQLSWYTNSEATLKD